MAHFFGASSKLMSFATVVALLLLLVPFTFMGSAAAAQPDFKLGRKLSQVVPLPPYPGGGGGGYPGGGGGGYPPPCAGGGGYPGGGGGGYPGGGGGYPGGGGGGGYPGGGGGGYPPPPGGYGARHP